MDTSYVGIADYSQNRAQRCSNRYRLVTIGTVLVCSVLLGACGSTGAQREVGEGLDARAHVFVGQCLVTAINEEAENLSVLGAIGNAVLPGLIDRTLGSVSTALRNAGEEDKHETLIRRNFEITAGTLPACIQIVHGRIDPGLESVEPGLVTAEGVDAAVVSDRLFTNRISLAERPSLFIELRLLTSTDGTAVRLIPALFEYNAHITPGSSGTDARALALEFSLHPAGIGSKDKTARISSVTFGAVEPGTVRRLLPKDESLSGWRPLLESPWFLAPDGLSDDAGKKDKSRPYTLSVTLTETRAANASLLALADIFDDARPALKNELEQQLLDNKREEAEITALTAANERTSAYLDAWITAETQLAALCALETGDESENRLPILTAAKDARKAQLGANIAALAAGLEPPYRTPLPIGDVDLEQQCP